MSEANEVNVVPEKSEKKIIPLTDRQEVENICLKITNMDLQRKLLTADMEKAVKQIQEFQEKLKVKAADLQKRYGVVLGRDKINDDGSFEVRANGPSKLALPAG